MAGEELTGGPGRSTTPLSIYSNIFQTFLNLNWSKDGLLVLESFEIKYTLK
jgi:hypothetical protein